MREKHLGAGMQRFSHAVSQHSGHVWGWSTKKSKARGIFPTKRSPSGRQGEGPQWRWAQWGPLGAVLLLWLHPGADVTTATTASCESCMAPRPTANDMIYLLPMELPD